MLMKEEASCCSPSLNHRLNRLLPGLFALIWVIACEMQRAPLLMTRPRKYNWMLVEMTAAVVVKSNIDD